mmetsp:Transcript_113658/g.361062  ORF Transcript_113658/g.361062 Transcript_113658/m.361062 type:complete len:291 (+) Transcript_113658:2415-3287(+)
MPGGRVETWSPFGNSWRRSGGGQTRPRPGRSRPRASWTKPGVPDWSWKHAAARPSLRSPSATTICRLCARRLQPRRRSPGPKADLAPCREASAISTRRTTAWTPWIHRTSAPRASPRMRPRPRTPGSTARTAWSSGPAPAPVPPRRRGAADTTTSASPSRTWGHRRRRCSSPGRRTARRWARRWARPGRRRRRSRVWRGPRRRRRSCGPKSRLLTRASWTCWARSTTNGVALAGVCPWRSLERSMSGARAATGFCKGACLAVGSCTCGSSAFAGGSICAGSGRSWSKSRC